MQPSEPAGPPRGTASAGPRRTAPAPQPIAAVVRTFRWSDHPATVGLWERTGRDAVPERELRAALEHGPELMVVADRADTGLVGAVLGTFDGRRGWIQRLAVLPEHRRGGVASALVGELEQRLAARGAPRVNLLVLPDNPEGLRFWQRRGYLPCPDVLCTKPLT
ncbi:GNAT family N-acetyltransferase [Kineococcus sp. R8]|uniref:GNAT family N-acetyltransferase n=1 Tax=Kineococcus siccus TaxID=2696567 RepID=UPI001411E2FD|nr:GNAT family N-acetyltransferase [Kineococcus siccus]